MITLFTTTNKITTAVLNSLESWDRLECVSEIFIFSDTMHNSDIVNHSNKATVLPSNEQEKPPLLKQIFKTSLQNSNNDFLCYINSDILLLSDFCRAFADCKTKFKNFQMIGRRINWEDPGWVRFDHDVTDQQIIDTVQAGSHSPHPYSGVDYFCFNKEVYEEQIDDMPDFYIARRRFDHYLAYCPKRVGAEVVDCSNKIYCIHHDESTQVRESDWNSKANFDKECNHNHILYNNACMRDQAYVNGIIDARTCEL
tara:strand:- start:311 stop:1075 length:765 start_codon:yes stop_codon:yes gene_type:complete